MSKASIIVRLPTELKHNLRLYTLKERVMMQNLFQAFSELLVAPKIPPNDRRIIKRMISRAKELREEALNKKESSE